MKRLILLKSRGIGKSMLQRLNEAQNEKRKRMGCECPTGWCHCLSCRYYSVCYLPNDDTDGHFDGELEGSYG